MSDRRSAPDAAQLLDALRRRGWTLGVAESCTGGLLGAAITAVAGSSDVFHGGIIAYANPVKEALLGVPRDILERYGAVSEECVRRMASGARTRLGCDAAVSVSGIAGPDGGTPEKPVGTVWIGVATPVSVDARGFRFDGDRDSVRDRAVVEAMRLMLEAADRSVAG